MSKIGKHLILVAVMGAAMLCSALYIRPPSIFDLPRYLDIFLNLKSYFAQGFLSGMLGFVLAKQFGVSKYSVFNIGISISVLVLALNSIRVQTVDLYYVQYSVLPLVVGIAGGITVAEYVQHFTTLGIRGLRRRFKKCYE
ncbi:hypothetical protein ACL7TT_19590 [Microbulbifer sp. 2304DJ12-6]|uniref:hypothetical protein n=1 Tax=Microbulbifer sp. 2304DJ12-6 TaxID=3233340 RepID=UPI0039AFA3F3